MLVAPTYRNIYDGVPMVWDLGGEGVINVIIGDRSTTPLGANIRNDRHNVTLDVHVLVASPQQNVSGNRESIQQAMRCVRECLLSDDGRRLDNPISAVGDFSVLLVLEVEARISGRPMLMSEDNPNALFDNADLKLIVRTFERAP